VYSESRSGEIEADKTTGTSQESFSMNPIVNGSPQYIIQGFQDLSGRAPVYDPVQLPSHLAHIFLYAEKGGSTPVMAVGDAFTSHFGSNTLNPQGKYYNHASVLASTIMNRGNAIMAHRIIPSDAAPPARLLLSLDIVADDIQQYTRDPDTQQFLRDQAGAKIPVTGAGATIRGHRAKWVLNRWEGTEGDETFGTVTNKVGSLVNSDSDQSTLYPILELEVSSQGAYGNNIGLRLEAPTSASLAPLNTTLAEKVNSYLYRLQVVQRTDATSTAQQVALTTGDTTMDVSFVDKLVNPATTAKISFTDKFVQSYQTLNQSGFTDQYGPFNRTKIYRQNLNTVLAMIASEEVDYGLLPASTVEGMADYLNLINVFTGTDLHSVPYYSFEVLGALQGGLAFSGTATHWAAGGSDGTMSDAAFDAAVRDQLLNYGTNGIDMLDLALYPQSCWYDSGFTLDTKLAAMTILGRRPDMWLVLSTQDVSQPQNTAADESAMAVALRTALRVYPESEIYGTGVCRGLVIGHSGHLLSDSYSSLLPLTIEFADRCANYMGAGDGKWKAGLGFDISPNNQVTMFNASTVNATFKSAQVRNTDWDNGLVWCQRFDTRSLFWPAVQTVYDDDSSTLNSPMTMFMACELVKVAFRTWADLTGRSDLTEEQLIERSDLLIQQRTRDRFDNRGRVIPETYFTADDTQRGYSWSTKMNLYSNTMRPVGSYVVVTRRLSDLSESAT
jgi:hypothetical protein